MRWTHRKGALALGTWLILTGLLPFLQITLPLSQPLLSILAVVAGILLILDR